MVGRERPRVVSVARNHSGGLAGTQRFFRQIGAPVIDGSGVLGGLVSGPVICLGTRIPGGSSDDWHLAYLDSVLGQYPDAAIVWTHRDPMEVMASTASLASTLRGAFSEGIDPVTTGQGEVDHLSTVLLRGMVWRDANAERERLFVDISFQSIMSDMIKQTKLEPDGSFRMVLAHRDPGVPNWIDTDGHVRGRLSWRFLLPEERVQPLRTRVVPVADILKR